VTGISAAWTGETSSQPVNTCHAGNLWWPIRVLQVENNYDVLINNGPSTRVLSPHGPCSRVSKMTPVFTGRVGKKHSQSQLHTPGTHYRLTLDLVTLYTPLKTAQNTPVQAVLT